jgi:hypothetical protein
MDEQLIQEKAVEGPEKDDTAKGDWVSNSVCSVSSNASTITGSSTSNTRDSISEQPDVAQESANGAEGLSQAKKRVTDISEANAAHAYGVSLSAVQALRAQFPESPPAEIGRYLASRGADGCPKKAAPLLKTHLEWRSKELAVYPAPPRNLPMHVNMLGKAKDGTQLLHFLSTSIDPAFSAEVHSQALLLWLDKNLPRESTMRLTVLLDVRGHHGLVRNRNIFDV